MDNQQGSEIAIEVIEESWIYHRTELIRHGDQITIRRMEKKMPIPPDQQKTLCEYDS